VAWNASGPVEGVFVIPGSSVKVPVGAAGVPAHVQVVEAWTAGAPPPSSANHAAPSVRAATVT